VPSARRTVEIYEELAELEHQRGGIQMRDRFLILAADTALSCGARDVADRLRCRLLELNPHHLLRPYPSLPDALKSPDVAGYVADLRDTYPPAEAGRMLEEMRPPSEKPGVDLEELRTLTSHPAADAEEEDGASQPQIYRFSDPASSNEDNETTATPAAPDAPRRAPRPARSSVAAPTVAETPEMFPYPTEALPPRARRPRAVETDEPLSGAGIWLSNALFGIVLLAGLALLVYTLGRPFFPL
jgi:hypothetical protein